MYSERSKSRIISTPEGTTAKNPFLLSKDEEKAVAKRQREVRHELTVPRR